MDTSHIIEEIGSAERLLGWELQSRIHKLNSYIQTDNGCVWVKRDDELSSGIIGSKKRKLCTLIPYILSTKPDIVVVEGSKMSHFVLACAQVFNEYQFTAKYYLLKPNNEQIEGRKALLDVLISSTQIHYLDRSQWKDRKEIIQNDMEGLNYCYIPEGGFHFQSLVGCMGLGLEIARHKQVFNHIFIDSGTGLTAMGLLIGILFLSKYQTSIHITLLADNEENFLIHFQEILTDFCQYYRLDEVLKIDFFLPNLRFHYPVTGKSFGSINKAVEITQKEIAQSEGILTDLVYTTKHFMVAKRIIESESLSGQTLIIHSGGALALWR